MTEQPPPSSHAAIALLIDDLDWELSAASLRGREGISRPYVFEVTSPI
jgi:hypothetical protein